MQPSDLSHVTVFGGSGFVGRHIVRALAKTGVRIRVAVRRPNQALFLKTAGRVGQIEIVQANIRDQASCKKAIEGTDAVINAVGILYETGAQTFASLQSMGAGQLAKLARRAGVTRFIQISALGVSSDSASAYSRTKAAGDKEVLKALKSAIILRPSLVIGPEDDFFNRFAKMAVISPFLPLIGGGHTRYQPVTVFDLAHCVVSALHSEQSGCFDIGGPRQYSFEELMHLMLSVIDRQRLLLPMPFAVARMIASVAQFLPKPPLTPDQVILLQEDNIVTGDNGLLTFGVTPQPIEAVLPDYLSRYRG